MRIPTRVTRSAIVAGLAFAASCGSDSATAPQTSASTSLSTAIYQSGVVDANSFSSARALTSVPVNSSATFDPSACTYSSADNSFTCPSKAVSGVTFQLKYFLFNSSGVAMSAYDAATTASVRTVWDAAGTFTTTGTSASTLQLTHHSDLTLTGLLGSSRSLNGTSTDHGVFDKGTGSSAVHVVADVAGAATNVVLPAAQGEYPASGLLSTDLTIATTSGGFSTTATGRGTLAFSGTKFALLTLSGGAGTMACTIDLSGATAPRC